MLSHGLIHDEIIMRDMFCNILQIDAKRLPKGETQVENIKISYSDFTMLYQLNVPRTGMIYQQIKKEIDDDLRVFQRDSCDPMSDKIVKQIEVPS